MSIIQNKNYTATFFIAYALFFWSCTESFRQQFADDIAWIPKHEYALFTEKGVTPVLSDKVPVILSIKFDKEWNNDRSNKPKLYWTGFLGQLFLHFISYFFPFASLPFLNG